MPGDDPAAIAFRSAGCVCVRFDVDNVSQHEAVHSVTCNVVVGVQAGMLHLEAGAKASYSVLARVRLGSAGPDPEWVDLSPRRVSCVHRL